MAKPKFNISDAKRYAMEYLENGADSVEFSLPKKSTQCVSSVLGISFVEAETVILEGIQRLGVQHFAHTQTIWQGRLDCDVYGLPDYWNHDWYVKFSLDYGYLTQVSFHPIEMDLRLDSGRVLKLKPRSEETG
jgi:hypothetical protein